MPPEAFRDRISEHNREALVAAGLSLAGGALAWVILYGVSYWLMMFLLSAVHGEHAKMPWWFDRLFGGIVVAVTLWALFEEERRRRNVPKDRPPLGWWVFRDLILWPPRLIFDVFGNLSAVRLLSSRDRWDAWQILKAARESGKLTLRELGGAFPDSRRLQRLLQSLQLLGYIDLHEGSAGWYYLLRSDHLDEVQHMINEAAP